MASLTTPIARNPGVKRTLEMTFPQCSSPGSLSSSSPTNSGSRKKQQRLEVLGEFHAFLDF